MHCYSCNTRLQTNHSVLLLCSCSVALCQCCARNQMSESHEKYLSHISCPVCSSVVTTGDLMIHGVEAALEAEENLVLVGLADTGAEHSVSRKEVISFVKLRTCLNKLRLVVDPTAVPETDEEPLGDRKGRGRNEASEKVNKKRRFEITKLVKVLCEDAKALPNPLDLIHFTCNPHIERAVVLQQQRQEAASLGPGPTEGLELDHRSCCVCTSAIAWRTSVLLRCACVVCRDCVLDSLVQCPSTCHGDGVQCPKCSTESKHVVINREELKSCEERLIESATGYFTSTLLTQPEPKRPEDLLRLFWAFGYSGTVTAAVLRHLSQERLRLEVCILEERRLNDMGVVVTMDSSPEQQRWGFLRGAEIAHNGVLEELVLDIVPPRSGSTISGAVSAVAAASAQCISKLCFVGAASSSNTALVNDATTSSLARCNALEKMVLTAMLMHRDPLSESTPYTFRSTEEVRAAVMVVLDNFHNVSGRGHNGRIKERVTTETVSEACKALLQYGLLEQQGSGEDKDIPGIQMTLRAIDLMRAGSLCVETAKYLETSLQELISKTRFLPGPPVVASMTSVTVGPAAARSAAVKVESAIEVVSSKRPPSRSVDLLGATATVGAVVEEKEDMADDWGRGYEAEFLRHRADGRDRDRDRNDEALYLALSRTVASSRGPNNSTASAENRPQQSRLAVPQVVPSTATGRPSTAVVGVVSHTLPQLSSAFRPPRAISLLELTSAAAAAGAAGAVPPGGAASTFEWQPAASSLAGEGGSVALAASSASTDCIEGGWAHSGRPGQEAQHFNLRHAHVQAPTVQQKRKTEERERESTQENQPLPPHKRSKPSSSSSTSSSSSSSSSSHPFPLSASVGSSVTITEAEIAKWQDDLLRAIERAEGAEQKLVASNRRITELESHTKRLEVTVENLRQNDAVRQQPAVANELDSLRQRERRLKDLCAVTEKRMQELNDSDKSLREKLLAKEELIATKDELVAAKDNEIAGLKDLAVSNAQEVGKLKREVKDMTDERNAAVMCERGLRKELKSAREANAKLVESNKESRQRIADLESSWQSQKSKHLSEMAALHQQLSKATAELTRWQSAVAGGSSSSSSNHHSDSVGSATGLGARAGALPCSASSSSPPSAAHPDPLSALAAATAQIALLEKKVDALKKDFDRKDATIVQLQRQLGLELEEERNAADAAAAAALALAAERKK